MFTDSNPPSTTQPSDRPVFATDFSSFKLPSRTSSSPSPSTAGASESYHPAVGSSSTAGSALWEAYPLFNRRPIGGYRRQSLLASEITLPPISGEDADVDVNDASSPTPNHFQQTNAEQLGPSDDERAENAQHLDTFGVRFQVSDADSIMLDLPNATVPTSPALSRTRSSPDLRTSKSAGLRAHHAHDPDSVPSTPSPNGRRRHSSVESCLMEDLVRRESSESAERRESSDSGPGETGARPVRRIVKRSNLFVRVFHHFFYSRAQSHYISVHSAKIESPSSSGCTIVGRVDR
jgi:hypothetical protein